jgi:hypothetical protein
MVEPDMRFRCLVQLFGIGTVVHDAVRENMSRFGFGSCFNWLSLNAQICASHSAANASITGRLAEPSAERFVEEGESRFRAMAPHAMRRHSKFSQRVGPLINR